MWKQTTVIRLQCEICSLLQLRAALNTSFIDPSSQLRVVVATITFGMGLDATNILSLLVLQKALRPTYKTGRCG